MYLDLANYDEIIFNLKIIFPCKSLIKNKKYEILINYIDTISLDPKFLSIEQVMVIKLIKALYFKYFKNDLDKQTELYKLILNTLDECYNDESFYYVSHELIKIETLYNYFNILDEKIIFDNHKLPIPLKTEIAILLVSNIEVFIHHEMYNSTNQKKFVS